MEEFSSLALQSVSYAQLKRFTQVQWKVHIFTTKAERKKLWNNFIHECDHCSELMHINTVHLVRIHYPPQQSLPCSDDHGIDRPGTYEEKPNINFKRRMLILHDVAEGLMYLHTHNPPVIHCDLSPNNILLKHLPLLSIAKISDLGMAK